MDPAAKAELVDAIEVYRLGGTPRSVPLTLLERRFASGPHTKAAERIYLDPYPEPLMPRTVF